MDELKLVGPQASSIIEERAQTKNKRVADMKDMPVIYISHQCVPAYVRERYLHKRISKLHGHLAERLSKRVTHYICSYQYYKHNRKIIDSSVKAYQDIQIVSFDWLERSILRKKWQHADRFLLLKQLESRANEKSHRKGIRLKMTESDVMNAQYSFTEDIQLNRMLLGWEGYKVAYGPDDRPLEAVWYKKNRMGERVVLRMVETVTLPKYFGCYALTRSPVMEAYVVCRNGVEYGVAFEKLCKFFWEETNVHWAARDSLRDIPWPGSGWLVYCP